MHSWGKDEAWNRSDTMGSKSPGGLWERICEDGFFLLLIVYLMAYLLHTSPQFLADAYL